MNLNLAPFVIQLSAGPATGKAFALCGGIDRLTWENDRGVAKCSEPQDLGVSGYRPLSYFVYVFGDKSSRRILPSYASITLDAQTRELKITGNIPIPSFGESFTLNYQRISLHGRKVRIAVCFEPVMSIRAPVKEAMQRALDSRSGTGQRTLGHQRSK